MNALRFSLGLIFSTALAGSLFVVVPVSAQTYTAQAIAAGSSLYGNYPYAFTGLLTTPAKSNGFSSSGSGAVVGNPRVVYSCAHVPFDSGAVDPWLNGIRWHRAWASASYPASSAGQLLRSYYCFVGYAAAARINPNSGSSFSQDFVVYYAFENTADAGYARSWNDGVSQLKSTGTKLITGYPSGLYASGDSRRYLMHQTGPFSRAFALNSADFLTVSEVSTGSGNSGGPVWVSNGTQYFFAGVLVSGLERSRGDITDLAGAYGVDASSLALINAAISASAAPVITTQPTSRRVIAGATADFAVVASGTNLSYRWLFNGSVLSGATGATLTLSSVTPAHVGTYQAVVSNAGGELSSLVVTLSVDVPPSITTQPVARSVAPGTLVTLSVAATGSGTPTYQWYRNGVVVADATGASYTLTNAQLANVGRYSVTVTNVAGTVASAPAQVNLVGLLWAMGNDGDRQLGIGTPIQRETPVAIANGVKAIVAGSSHSLYLKTDGTLWAVGRNTEGQLGDGATTQRNSPVQVATGVSAVAAGAFHSLHLKTDGTLWAMGGNSYGQLGDGTTMQRNSPVQVATGVSAVAAGGYHSMYLQADGTLWTMGRNTEGQLGDNTTTQRNSPVQVATGVSAMSAGLYHSMYLKIDGTLWTMGRNTEGQLGDSTATQRNSPVQVATGVSAVAAGALHSLHLKTDGTLWAVGRNTEGQLGDGATTQRNSSVQVATGVSAVTAGGYHSLYLKTDGTLWAVGRNTEGQLGDGTIVQRNSPVQVATGVSAVAAGALHSLHLKADGTLWAMGRNSDGQLGDGTTMQRNSPVQVATGVSAVAAGAFHSLYLKTDGTLWAVGRNTEGQLGDGATTQRNSPVQVASGVSAVAAGGYHSMYLQADGTLWTMGRNTEGQLGDNTTTQRNSPVQVATGVSAMSAGLYHSMYLKIDGTLWTMGRNSEGQLGDGTTTQRNSPVQVATGVSTVAACAYQSFHLRTDGTLWAMGFNGNGQLGDGTTTQRNSPVQVATGVSAVAAGAYHASYLKTDGTLWAFGYNGAGQLGDGTTTQRNLAVQVASNVLTVATGNDSSYFVQTAGVGTVPAVTAQPVGGRYSVGASVTLTVAATGSGSLDYRWRKDGVEVPGARSATLILPFMQTSYVGSYSVIVTNSAGSVTSSAAAVILNVAPVVTTQLQPQLVNGGANVTFTVTASGTPAPTYQWRKDGVAISGATDASYRIASAVTSDAGSYDVVVTNPVSSVTSNAATLTVIPALIATQVVAHNSLTAGTAAVAFTPVTASGGTVPYIFAVSPVLPTGLALSAATGTITGTPSAASATTTYTVTVTDSAGATSNKTFGLIVTSGAPPTAVITSPTLGANLTVGVLATVTANATATAPATIASVNFFVNGGAIGSDTTFPYSVTFTPVTSATNIPITAIVTDSLGNTFTTPPRFVNFVPIPAPTVAITAPVSGATVSVGAATTVSATATAVAAGATITSIQFFANGVSLGTGVTAPFSVTWTPTAGGNFSLTATATDSNGTSTVSAAAVVVIVSSGTAPVIVTHPLTQATSEGTGFVLNVNAIGTAPLTYQWRKGGVAISGATSASFSVASAMSADAGSYTVVVTNGAGSATSNAATITTFTGAAVATHTVAGAGYTAGGIVTITNTLSYSGTATGLGWQVLLPAGWSFASDGGSAGTIKPAVGTTDVLEWAWVSIPASAVTFTYTLNVPAGQTGDKPLVALAKVRLSGFNGALQVVAKSDPLIVSPITTHSADTDKNFSLSLLELTRVIEVYNTRNGTSRTGGYKVDATGEDGFGPEPTRTSSAVVTLAVYHSADSDRNGRLSLAELTRVIELYNYRVGTIRTGDYHVQAGTEDGFNPGP